METRAPDKWDIKAARVHGDDRPAGTPVRLVGVGVSFPTVFLLVLYVTIAQAIIGAVVLAVLFATGVLTR